MDTFEGQEGESRIVTVEGIESCRDSLVAKIRQAILCNKITQDFTSMVE